MSDIILFVVLTALCCLPLALLFAAAGLPLTSAMLLFSPPKRVKVFRDKFGQQTATLCLLTGLAALVCLAAAGFLLARTSPAIASFWFAWPLPLAPLTAGLALAGLLALVYRALWQTLKQKRPVHAAIGVVATLAAWAQGYLFITFFRHLVTIASAPGADPALFAAPPDSLAWILLPLVCALSLALAGAAASLYLTLRRNKDDFGRDYYNYALKLACKWALFSSLPALALHSWFFIRLWPAVRELPIAPLLLWSENAAGICLVLACLLWAAVLKAKNPLRLKFLCLCAAALAWLALAAMAVGSVKYFLG